jgi:hypothetical protein
VGFVSPVVLVEWWRHEGSPLHKDIISILTKIRIKYFVSEKHIKLPLNTQSYLVLNRGSSPLGTWIFQFKIIWCSHIPRRHMSMIN